jgi:hypothetical protein
LWDFVLIFKLLLKHFKKLFHYGALFDQFGFCVDVFGPKLPKVDRHELPPHFAALSYFFMCFLFCFHFAAVIG